MRVSASFVHPIVLLFRAKAKDFDGAGECMQCNRGARSLSVAESAFLRALELSPGDDGALFNLAVLYGNNGMEEEMRSTLHQLLQVLART
jgi:hypothetical protein